MRKKEEKPITSLAEYKRRLFWVNFVKVSAVVLFFTIITSIFLVFATDGKIITAIFGVKLGETMDVFYGLGYIIVGLASIAVIVLFSVRLVLGIIDKIKEIINDKKANKK